MKAQLLLAGIILGMSGISACTGNKKNVMTEKETMEVWKDYPVGHIVFDDQAPETEGSKVYHRIIANPQEYIADQARTVLAFIVLVILKTHLQQMILLSCFLKQGVFCYTN